MALVMYDIRTLLRTEDLRLHRALIVSKTHTATLRWRVAKVYQLAADGPAAAEGTASAAPAADRDIN